MGSQSERYALENAARPPHNGRRIIGPRKDGKSRLKHTAWIIAATALLASAGWAASTPSSGRKMYKWVDSQGLTHFGDHIPPEYAAQEQHIINSQGVEVDRLEAQKTPEQVAAEEQKRLDAERKLSRDHNLLNTYVSVQEIERLRDQRLALVSDQVRVTSQFLEILNARLKKMSANSMRFKPYNTDPHALPMPDQMAEDLVRTGNDIRTQEQNLRQKRTEEAAMRMEFENDIDRFKELKGIH
jgi:Domain of unknown function (DUF4124)